MNQQASSLEGTQMLRNSPEEGTRIKVRITAAKLHCKQVLNFRALLLLKARANPTKGGNVLDKGIKKP